ncbi:hypothetical protein Nepgr_017509 [Nepenthes gracilis]|uniref:Uncharacterized protein n=1 Tax=Nepenthes gracilis TaxID=150966 RepID=A0AAD3SQI0_NEPGR|nr:hypothetical protein Nepgr_017509 [Nepenthes gracilis]
MAVSAPNPSMTTSNAFEVLQLCDVSILDVDHISKSRFELGIGSAMETSNAFDVLQNYKEDASESAGQEIFLAGDREDLAPDLVIPQQPNKRDYEQKLDPSCDLLPCCCWPDLVSAPEESNHRKPESSTSPLKPSDRRESSDHPYLALEVADQVTAPSRTEQVGSMKQSTSQKQLKSTHKKPKGAKV